MNLPSLIYREVLEHRGAFVYVPVGLATWLVGVLLIAMLGQEFISIDSIQIDADEHESSETFVMEGGSLGDLIDIGIQRLQSETTPEDREMGMKVAGAALSLPFLAVAFFVMATYFVGTVHREREDRTVLFFKSMPVSDLESIGGKVLAGFVAAPLIAVSAAILTHFFVLLILTPVVWLADGSAWSLLWVPASPPTLWPWLAAATMTQCLWMAPVYGWLLFASATFRSPLLFVFLVPAGIGLAEAIVMRDSIIFQWFVEHIRPVFADSDDDELNIMQVLAMPDLYAGIVVGGLFVAGTVLQRAPSQ